MEKMDFNGGWIFSRWDAPEQVVDVRLPHDAMLHERRDPDCKNGKNTGYYPGGKYLYQKKFTPPPAWHGKSLLLEFEGIYQNAEVSLNGSVLCRHPYGYTGFYVDIADPMIWDGENILTVSVDNSGEPSSRWYSGSGIYRPVWLHVGEAAHILPDGIQIQTLSYAPAVLRISVDVSAGEPQIRLLDGKKVVAAASGHDVTLSVPDAKLWDCNHPNLYVCEAILIQEGQVVDSASVTCGICKLEWSTKGLFINGIETKLRGACIHHDNGILGACDFRESDLRRIRILKDAGFNAIRSAHNPISKDMLDACDRLGMYVMDEFADMWYLHKTPYDYAGDFPQWSRRDITAMVRKDYSHPCVVMYSIGNEVTETAEVPGVAAARELTELVHFLDHSRPVTCGINMTLNVMHFAGMDTLHNEEAPSEKPELIPKGFAHMAELKQLKGSSAPSASPKAVGSEYFNQMMAAMGDRMRRTVRTEIGKAVSEDAFAALDIAGYNYADGRYELDQTDYPDRISVGSETLPQDIIRNWRMVCAFPYLIGDFIWSGWDYIGEARIGSFRYKSTPGEGEAYPALLGGCGVIDITGMHRPEVHLNRIAYGLEKGPYLSVEPVTHGREEKLASAWRLRNSVRSWSWRGCEGFPAEVVVYANAQRVELFLNGVSLGCAAPVDCQATFQTEYCAGVLRAVAYDAKGIMIGCDELISAGEDQCLTVIPSKDILTADGQDLCYLDVLLTDKHGIVHSAQDVGFTVRVTGAGELAAIGSADPFAVQPYTGCSHQTYYGRGQAVVRSGVQAGTIHIRIEAEGYSAHEMTISVQ